VEEMDQEYLEMFDFYDTKIEDKLYYDPQHLNETGAVIFTDILIS
jgi:hypothetical protein